MEYLKLIGIVIIVLGFALKFDVLATVLLAGLVTGIVAGMDIPHILSILVESFVSNRLMSIFLIIFPVIAIIESENEVEELKGHAAAVENFGNFFAQNCFAAASGVVLIQGTLSMYKEVTLPSIAMASIPVMVITVAFTFVQVFLFDRKVKKAGARHD